MSDLAVKLAAQEVAMRAMIGELDQSAVDNMRALAEELACGQVLFRAIIGFATQYEILRYDAAALRRQGEILRDVVIDVAGTPAGSGTALPERSDIDG